MEFYFFFKLREKKGIKQKQINNIMNVVDQPVKLQSE
jgi:hypothetical protein